MILTNMENQNGTVTIRQSCIFNNSTGTCSSFICYVCVWTQTYCYGMIYLFISIFLHLLSLFLSAVSYQQQFSKSTKARMFKFVVQLKFMLIMGIYIYVYSVPCYLNGVITWNAILFCGLQHYRQTTRAVIFKFGVLVPLAV